MDKLETTADYHERYDELLNDVTLSAAVTVLQELYKIKFNEYFPDEETDGELFEEFCHQVYSSDRECDPDEASVLMPLFYK
jgi:hypothetical protein